MKDFIMKQNILILVILTGLFGCNEPTEIPVMESSKLADKFARSFIDKIISGQLDSAFAVIEPAMLNTEATEFLTNASRNVNGAIIKKYTVVESSWTTSFVSKTGKTKTYRLGYEYEFENGNGNILFTTTIKEKDGKFLVSSFNGEFLKAPLAELTKFTLSGKNPLQYIILILSILVPLFILTTLIIMLRSKMTTKKKIIWTLIILFISLPRFVINWNNGVIDFNLLNFTLLGSSFSKPTLYSAWLLSFNIPIGALIFWYKRESLLPEQEDTEYENLEVIENTPETITNE
jgi:hypothetical protein